MRYVISRIRPLMIGTICFLLSAIIGVLFFAKFDLQISNPNPAASETLKIETHSGNTMPTGNFLENCNNETATPLPLITKKPTCEQNIDSTTTGKILFLRRSTSSTDIFTMIFLDVQSNEFTFVGRSTGIVSVSKNGKFIAYSCHTSKGWNSQPTEDDEICIIRTDMVIPTEFGVIPHGIAEPVFFLPLPSNCLIQYQSKKVFSLSWSNQNDAFAVICGSELREGVKKLCIIPLEGNADCLEVTRTDEEIRYVSWSPDGDTLAFSGYPDSESKIYLVDSGLHQVKLLTNGWNPEWSPDGSKLAIFQYIPDSEFLAGIRTVDLELNSSDWLYQTPPTSSMGEGIIYLDGCLGTVNCKLSWSPDGKYLAFIAPTLGLGNFELFKLDVESKEIKILFDNAVIGNDILNPDWGKW